jgi:uncharacterized protein
MMRMLAALVLVAAAPAEQNPHLPTPTHDSLAPELPSGLDRAVLIVSKTNGWRHLEHIPRSNAVIAGIARTQGRAAFVTENAAVFNDADLSRFAVVVLNSASGNFMTAAQEAALRRFVERGGGVVALHAAGDDSHTTPWYTHTIVGTRFTGHPGGDDQFQAAAVRLEQPTHPVLRGVTSGWRPREEWYSFDRSPRGPGTAVLATVDEASYRPGAKLAMGATHPVIWVNPRTRGRVVYSALGHEPVNYDDPNYRLILTNAIRWAAR